ELIDGRIALGQVAHADDDGDALLAESARGFQTQAAIAAGDECNGSAHDDSFQIKSPPLKDEGSRSGTGGKTGFLKAQPAELSPAVLSSRRSAGRHSPSPPR